MRRLLLLLGLSAALLICPTNAAYSAYSLGLSDPPSVAVSGLGVPIEADQVQIVPSSHHTVSPYTQSQAAQPSEATTKTGTLYEVKGIKPKQFKEKLKQGKQPRESR